MGTADVAQGVGGVKWYDAIFCCAMVTFVVIVVLLHYDVIGGR